MSILSEQRGDGTWAWKTAVDKSRDNQRRVEGKEKEMRRGKKETTRQTTTTTQTGNMGTDRRYRPNWDRQQQHAHTNCDRQNHRLTERGVWNLSKRGEPWRAPLRKTSSQKLINNAELAGFPW